MGEKLYNEFEGRWGGGRAVADSYRKGFHTKPNGEKVKMEEIDNHELENLFGFYKGNFRQQFFFDEGVKRGLINPVQFEHPQWGTLDIFPSLHG